MARSATIHKIQLQLSDLDRDVYDTFNLTLARHPSETEERLLVRLQAFIWHADHQLTFTRGLCADDEPELWRKNLQGEVELWVEVGLPDERRLKKACHRAREVWLYTYGGRAADLWWAQNRARLASYGNLKVLNLPEESTRALAALSQRTLNLQGTIQEGQAWIGTEQTTLCLAPRVLQALER